MLSTLLKWVPLWVWAGLILFVVSLVTSRSEVGRNLLHLPLAPTPSHCATQGERILVILLVTPAYRGQIASILQNLYVQSECRKRLHFYLFVSEDDVDHLGMIVNEVAIPKEQLQQVKIPLHAASCETSMLAHGYTALLQEKNLDSCFTLLLDPLVGRVAPRWDTTCIRMWQDAALGYTTTAGPESESLTPVGSLSTKNNNNKLVLLSGFPYHWSSEGLRANYLVAEQFDAHLSTPLYRAVEVTSNPRAPLPTMFWSWRFSFGPTALFSDAYNLRWDPHFQTLPLAGYDFLMNTRLRRAGVQIFHPHIPVMGYGYTDPTIPLHSYTPTEGKTLLPQVQGAGDEAKRLSDIGRVHRFFHIPAAILHMEPRFWTDHKVYGFTEPEILEGYGKRSYVPFHLFGDEHDFDSRKRQGLSRTEQSHALTFARHMGVDIQSRTLSISAKLGLSQNWTQSERAAQEMSQDELTSKFTSIHALEKRFLALKQVEMYVADQRLKAEATANQSTSLTTPTLSTLSPSKYPTTHPTLISATTASVTRGVRSDPFHRRLPPSQPPLREPRERGGRRRSHGHSHRQTPQHHRPMSQ